MKSKDLFILLLILSFIRVNGQNQTVGLFLNDTNYSCPGYTVFAPKHNTMTYIINNEGEKVHEWTACNYAPGQTVYLLENGNLLRTCMIMGGLNLGGGEGGRLEEYTWNDSLIWEFNYSTQDYTQHHDARMLPNGNVIMLVAEKKTYSQIIQAGFDPSKLSPAIISQGYMCPDAVYEVQPVPPSGGIIVWEWHIWDHLIQDYDASKNNYGVVNQHPELVDCDGDHRILQSFWNHMNSIDYNPAFDEIVLSVRGNSELWVIDHSTTTAQAAGHTGGFHNKGGDLLYRWGNPLTYGRGTNSDKVYDEQHAVEWVRPDCPGAGNFTCFNNGIQRGYSTIDEITPPVDASGNYTLATGAHYGPSSLTWTYAATPPESLFAKDISGAVRLQNGNILIDNGPLGTFTEVTPSGQIVWKYVNPTINTRTLCRYDTIPHDPTHPDETMNSIFRVYRYPPDYAAFIGKDLTPQGPIECFPTGVSDLSQSKSSHLTLSQNIPNPASYSTDIRFKLNISGFVTLTIRNIWGDVINSLVSETKEPGEYSYSTNTYDLPNGIYCYTLTVGNESKTRRMTVIR